MGFHELGIDATAEQKADYKEFKKLINVLMLLFSEKYPRPLQQNQ